MKSEMKVFHYPAFEGQRIKSFQVVEPGGSIQLIFEDGQQAQISATLRTCHPSIRHGDARIEVTAQTVVRTFIGGGPETHLREPVP